MLFAAAAAKRGMNMVIAYAPDTGFALFHFGV
jgi:hypothetical protein